MRFTSLTLHRYGHFAAQQLRFDAAPGRVNLVLAGNGAGKSVLRQAISDLLFGIGGQTPMGFRHGYTGMRISAEAIGRDGTAFAFGRRKGIGNTLLDSAGAAADPALLQARLGSADRDLLERLFVLDTERLRRGGDDLLRAGGSLAEALLSAAGGLRDARRLRDGFNEARDALAPLRRIAQRPFYQALDSLLAARRSLKDATLAPETWAREAAALGALQRQRDAANLAVGAAQAELARLERIRRVRAPLAEHAAAVAWLDAHPDAPELPDGLGARLAAAREALARAEDAATRTRDAHAALAAELVASQPDTALLDAAPAIAALVQEAGAAAKARSDIPARATDQAMHEARIGELLRALGSPLPAARAAEALPGQPAIARARRLIERHAALAAGQAAAQLAALEPELAAVAAALAALPADSDMTTLSLLLAELRAEGDPIRRQDSARRELGRADAAHTVALAQLPGGAEALLAAALPPQTGFERLHAALLTASAALAAQQEAAARLAAQQAVLLARAAELVAGQTLPDAAAIAAARRYRDTGWQLIHRRAFGDGPAHDDEQRYAGDTPLPLAYERAVGAADRLSDRRDSEAARLAEAAQLARDKASLEAQAQGIAAALAAAEAAQAAARAAWADAIAPLRLGAAAGINELREVLAARAAALSTAAARRVAQAIADEQASRNDEAARRLAAALGEAAPGQFSALLAAADARLAAAQQQAAQRAALVERERGLATQRDAARRNSATAAEALAQWRNEWVAALASLERPAGEDPASTAEALDLLTSLATAADRAADLARRLRDMHADIAGFAARCHALAARLTPALDSSDPVATAFQLADRLATEQGAEQRRQLLRQQAAAAEQATEAAQRALESASTELRSVIAASGAASGEAAEQRIALAAERAAANSRRANAAAALHEAGDGLSLDALRAEAATLTVEQHAAASAAARAGQAAQAIAAQTAAADAARADEKLRQAGDATTARDAAATEAAAAATLARTLDEALLAHTAATLLDAALQAVEQGSDGGLLARLGSCFRGLTCGAYSGVGTEPAEDGSARLCAIEAAGDAKAVEQLSEGTRDQLFLALRLLTIEDHVAQSPPLPFVGDDILQTFDDQRAAAAFAALLTLSAHTQVIVLTHHRHLLDIARTLPPGALHLCSLDPATEPLS